MALASRYGPAMWSEVPAFVLGLLTLAVTTNLFARRASRDLRELHRKAEVLSLMPEGPGRAELAAHVDAAASRLVADLGRSPTARRAWEVPLMVVAVLAALVWIGGATSAAVWDDRPGWVRSLSLAGLVITAACTTVMAVSSRREGGRP